MEYDLGFRGSYGGSSGIGEMCENGDIIEPQPMDTGRPVIGKLRQSYKFIKEELHSSDKVVDALYQEKFISRDCREKILALVRSDNARANDFIIKDLVHYFEKLSDRNYSEQARKFNKILADYGSDYLLNDQSHVTDCDQEDTSVNERPALTVNEMTELLRLEKNQELLKDELEPKRIIDDLLEDGVLTFDDHEDIAQKAHRPERVTSLLAYVGRDIMKKCPAFLKAVRLCRPSLEETLLTNLKTSYSEKDETDETGLKMTYTVKEVGSRRVTVEVPSHCDITLRLKFVGEQMEITAVEHDMVNLGVRPELDIEAMECETSIDGLYFSSVVIRLRTHTYRAAKRLTHMLCYEPEGLKRWLKGLLTDEQKLKLKTAGWDSVSVEITAVPQALTSGEDCHCVLSKHGLSRALVVRAFKEELRNVRAVIKMMYDKQCFTHDQRQEMTRVLNMSEHETKIQLFVDFICSLDDERLCLLESSLRKAGQFSLMKLTGADNPKDGEQTHKRHKHINRCTSMASSYVIKQSLPNLPREQITGINGFLEDLAEDSRTLNADQIASIKAIRKQSYNENKTLEFLHLLTELPQSCICRFERFLKRTEQYWLLTQFKEYNALLEYNDVTKDEIRENLSFLSDDIEPRMFLHILDDQDKTTLSTQGRRKQRCREFFECVLKSYKCDFYLRKFEVELERLKLYNVIKILRSSKRSKNLERARVYGDTLKHKILENNVLLTSEVDIAMLKTTFVDRRILTSQQFDAIASKGSRKDGVVALLKEVLDQGYPAMICLIAALKIAGYIYIAGSIENTADTVIPCPCYSSTEESQTLLDATFSVQIAEVNEDQSTTPENSDGDTPSWSTETLESNVVTTGREIDNTKVTDDKPIADKGTAGPELNNTKVTGDKSVTEKGTSGHELDNAKVIDDKPVAEIDQISDETKDYPASVPFKLDELPVNRTELIEKWLQNSSDGVYQQSYCQWPCCQLNIDRQIQIIHPGKDTWCKQNSLFINNRQTDGSRVSTKRVSRKGKADKVKTGKVLFRYLAYSSSNRCNFLVSIGTNTKYDEG